MSQEIQQYIHNQRSRSPSLLDSLTRDDWGNPHLPRNIFIPIKKWIDDFVAGNREIRIIGIPGLRGVGKTTLLAQIFQQLFKNYPNQILYISVDQVVNLLHSDLLSALEAYQSVIGTSFERLTSPLFLLIDEIHYDENWPSVLKSVYDRSRNVFVICTGSSALSLQSTADLARRIFFEKLYPLSFSEYILLKTHLQSKQSDIIQPIYPVEDLGEDIRNALFYSDNASDCFQKLKKLQIASNNYWQRIDKLEIDGYLKFRNMPFALSILDEGMCSVLVDEIIDKVVEKDLSVLKKFTASTISKAKNILLMAASSDEISFTSFAKNLTNISSNTLMDLFDAFRKAEILIRAYPYGSAFKKVRKPSKYFFMSPSLRYTLLEVVEGDYAFFKYKGKYLEDIVALSIYRGFKGKKTFSLCYDSAKGGADFILQLGQRKVVLEVGHGEKGIGQVRQTMKKHSGNYGIVVSNTNLELIESESIIKLPIEMFLLI